LTKDPLIQPTPLQSKASTKKKPTAKANPAARSPKEQKISVQSERQEEPRPWKIASKSLRLRRRKEKDLRSAAEQFLFELEL
jgi:hypothetical protein